MAEFPRRLFLDPSPVANRNNPHELLVVINSIDDTKSPHPVFPEPFALSPEWFTGIWGTLRARRACLMLRFTSGGRCLGYSLRHGVGYPAGRLPLPLPRLGWLEWFTKCLLK
jgi:hypothetical protein